MQGSISVQFVILPENFTYELECPAGATWAQAKVALEADLAIKQENMRIRVDGADVQDDAATMAADGVVSGMQLELEVVYADAAPAVEAEVFEGVVRATSPTLSRSLSLRGTSWETRSPRMSGTLP